MRENTYVKLTLSAGTETNFSVPSKLYNRQMCWSESNNVADPGHLPPIPDSGFFFIQDGSNNNKKRGKKLVMVPFLVAITFTKLTALRNLWVGHGIQDPGSRILIPGSEILDLGSVTWDPWFGKKTYPGSDPGAKWHRIYDPDPQRWKEPNDSYGNK